MKIDPQELFDDPRLTAFVLGELNVEEAQAVQQAVEADPKLAREVEQIRAVCDQLSGQFASSAVSGVEAAADLDTEKEFKLTDSQKQRITDTIPANKNRPGKKAKSKRKDATANGGGSWRRFAIAASLLVLVGLGGILLVSNPNQVVNLVGGKNEDNSEEVAQQEHLVKPNRAVPRDDLIEQIESTGLEFKVEGGDGKSLGLDPEVLRSNLSLVVGREAANDPTNLARRPNSPATVDVRRSEIDLFMHEWERGIAKFPSSIGERQLDLLERIDELSIELNDVDQDLGENSDLELKAIRDKLLLYKRQLGRGEQKPLDAKNGKSWKRVRAVPNASRLMVGDKDELALSGMQVNVRVDGFRARVVIDYFYYNDRDRQLEGNFKLRLPNDASPYFFAFGESRFDFSPTVKPVEGMPVEPPRLEREFLKPGGDGERFTSLDPGSIRDLRKGAWDNVKEARMVPRQKAAFAYQQTTKRRIDPALVEWAGAGVFNAKVFPLSPRKLHRIVVGYDVDLARVDGRWVYQLALPELTGDCRVDVRVTSTDELEVSPAVEIDKFDGTANFVLENPESKVYSLAIPAEAGTFLVDDPEGEMPLFATRAEIALPRQESVSASHAVILIDTSLSSEVEKFNLWLKMLTRLLKENRDELKRFAVVIFNAEAYWWKQGYVDNSSENVEELIRYCNQLALEGATDLYSAIRLVRMETWLGDNQSARPDLFLLSDGAATWGETNLQVIGRELELANTGRLFAYQAGMTGTSIRALRFLTSKSGGAVFSIVGENEAREAATAHRNQPWQLVSVQAEGASDLLTAGRVQWVYPDQSILVVGRGNPQGELVLNLKRGKRTRQLKLPVKKKLDSQLAFRAYGQVSTGQLENLGDRINDISTAYARNFRVTGRTCSLLMLDSEADYQRFNIKPEDDAFVVSAKSCSETVEKEYRKNREKLGDPREMLVQWLEQLEDAPQIGFKMPTSLALALEKVEVPVVAGRLQCQLRLRELVPSEYRLGFKSEKLDYDAVVKQAKFREQKYSTDDAIKALSSLVERNPGDLQLIRDVAMMAMELDRPAQAYPLLWKVVQSRPYNASLYPALGQCLTAMGNADLAIVFYEIAINGNFPKQDFRKIATTEYVSLLKQIERGEFQSSLRNYAVSRLNSLKGSHTISEADLVVTMMWNTDRTDVDLHVVDSAGEECYYEHPKTKMGGKITADITDGYGPEMFWLPKARDGRYRVKVNYYGSDGLRTGMRSKVYLTIYRNFGRPSQKVERKTVSLGKSKEMREVATIRIQE